MGTSSSRIQQASIRNSNDSSYRIDRKATTRVIGQGIGNRIVIDIRGKGCDTNDCSIASAFKYVVGHTVDVYRDAGRRVR